MKSVEVIYKNAWPYLQNKMNLPVENLSNAIPFYEKIMGFEQTAHSNSPYKSAILKRNEIEIGLSENGEDPSQDGCFFEVNDVQAAFDELRANGFTKENPDFSFQQHGATRWKVFFVVAPDGLCYCIGEMQK
ncbi:VOC family protein [Emticicia agri]|uniref:VOC family protein n=1 Tax=Emticicia agri TaxID=2492393 RepID=A0A4V1ZCX7_9BACT|nr:VOC family protein [Emticicia agri]RYU94200.1 VOC family protein [Emticicia agri]